MTIVDRDHDRNLNRNLKILVRKTLMMMDDQDNDHD
jgi:hypothetical protein